MCWGHVHRHVESKTRSIDAKNRQQIRADIDDLQGLSTPELFEYGYSKFLAKWRAKNNIHINEFLDYFNSEWIESSNNKWYEGAAKNIPSTDNGLESTNNTIKKVHTLRKLLGVNDYLPNCCTMLHNWSKNLEKDKPFHDDVNVDGQTWSFALESLRNKHPIHRIGNSNDYILISKNFKGTVNKLLVMNKVDKLILPFLLLNIQNQFVKLVSIETIGLSCCSCSFFLKNYFCYLIVVTVNEEILEIPIQHNTTKIAPKAKRGRKADATKALAKQK
jgi:hypothetical protein